MKFMPNCKKLENKNCLGIEDELNEVVQEANKGCKDFKLSSFIKDNCKYYVICACDGTLNHWHNFALNCYGNKFKITSLICLHSNENYNKLNEINNNLPLLKYS